MIVQTLNNPINMCLINPNIILYYVSLIKYLWISKISIVSITLKSTEKTLTTPFNPVFFVLLIGKSLEILPKNGIYGFYF